MPCRLARQRDLSVSPLSLSALEDVDPLSLLLALVIVVVVSFPTPVVVAEQRRRFPIDLFSNNSFFVFVFVNARILRISLIRFLHPCWHLMKTISLALETNQL
ncbi:hypothetical protein NE237_019992 [Protea cynaroides]|uniref:Uncharacterized protein n=1 Tax=Protea cynaroides TaxID=273540 RepID=A0A9Q0H573_9MAGN|nr:hypothetical protein NE237_019992 [Protea cynaroides]